MNNEINEIKITVPEGMEIDRENSSFECIKFKKKEEIHWREKTDVTFLGYGIDVRKANPIVKVNNLICPKRHCGYATIKQAKSALAMAQISQIMANDPRFGGVVTDEEWDNGGSAKYVIYRSKIGVFTDINYWAYNFLAFHTREQRDLFLKENEDLVKDYLMID